MKFDSHRKEERFKNLNPRKFLDEKADKFRAEEPRKLTSEGTDELESNLSYWEDFSKSNDFVIEISVFRKFPVMRFT